MPFRNYFFQMVEGIAAAYGCTVSYNSITEPAFAVSNDPECAAFARKVIGEELGNDVIAFPEPWMASESFSQLQKLWPGVFALLGINNPEKGTGAAHHNEYFDLDEDVFKLGVAGAVTYALRFLDGDVDTSSRQWKGSVPRSVHRAWRQARSDRQLLQGNPRIRVLSRKQQAVLPAVFVFCAECLKTAPADFPGQLCGFD